MQLRTADILSRPGAEASPSMVSDLIPPNPLPQMAENVESSRGVHHRHSGISGDLSEHYEFTLTPTYFIPMLRSTT